MEDNFIKRENIFDKYLFEEDENERSGSSAVVKKCLNTKDSDLYGIKCICLDDYDKEKVLSEVRVLKNLNHPNIVKAYEAFCHEEDGYCFIVFEWMEGGELFDRLSNIRGDEEVIKEIFRKLVDVVRYCHRIGLVHRDLKVR